MPVAVKLEAEVVSIILWVSSVVQSYSEIERDGAVLQKQGRRKGLCFHVLACLRVEIKVLPGQTKP